MWVEGVFVCEHWWQHLWRSNEWGLRAWWVFWPRIMSWIWLLVQRCRYCKTFVIFRFTQFFIRLNGNWLIVNESTISVVKNCYCEYDYQEADSNGIMCNTTDGASYLFGSCDAGQICTGDGTENYASRKSELCS